MPVFILLLAGGALVLYSGFVTIPMGHEGILMLRDEPQQNIRYTQGTHWIWPIPYINKMVVGDIRIREKDLAFRNAPFRIRDFVDVSVSFPSVRWAHTDTFAITQHETPPSDSLIESSLRRVVKSLAQENVQGALDVLGGSARLFPPPELATMVNAALANAQIPARILSIADVDPRCESPLWDKFWLAAGLIKRWSDEKRTSGEVFLENLTLDENGRVSGGTHSVDVSGILDILREYFRGR